MRIRPRSACLAIALAIACHADAYLPSALHGRWISDDARYAGRSLTISPSLLSFAGDGITDTFTVRGVEVQPGEGATSYAVTYGAEGGDDMQLRLQLHPGNPPKLKLGDRRESWKPAPRDWGMR